MIKALTLAKGCDTAREKKVKNFPLVCGMECENFQIVKITSDKIEEKRGVTVSVKIRKASEQDSPSEEVDHPRNVVVSEP